MIEMGCPLIVIIQRRASLRRLQRTPLIYFSKVCIENLDIHKSSDEDPTQPMQLEVVLSGLPNR